MSDANAFLATLAALAVIKVMLLAHEWLGPLISFDKRNPDGDDGRDDPGAH